MRDERGGASRFLLPALAVAAFVLVAGLIRSAVPWPAEYGMAAKMDAFLEARDEFTAIYVGPSTVFRSFRPEVIDPLVSEATGLPFRSYNLGMGAHFGHEVDAQLREILALEPKNLRWVFIQPSDYYGDFRLGRNIFTERSVRWHDLRGTLDGLESAWLRDDPVTERLDLTWIHLQLAAWHLGNYGLGPRIVEALAGGDDDYREVLPSMRTNRGYQALEDWDKEDIAARALRLRRNPGEYEEAIDWLTERQDNTMDLSAFNLRALQRQQQILADAGLRCIYVMPPMITPPTLVNTLARDGHLPTFINLDTPARVPELYELRYRFDRGHLNRQGADVFSRMFADAVIELLAEEHDG
jgi:hypothetical protein